MYIDAPTIYQLFKTFENIIAADNIPWFLCFDTALGAVRHHGPIPWTNGFQICIHESNKNVTKKALDAFAAAHSNDHDAFATVLTDKNVQKFSFLRQNNGKGIPIKDPQNNGYYLGYTWPFIEIHYANNPRDMFRDYFTLNMKATDFTNIRKVFFQLDENYDYELVLPIHASYLQRQEIDNEGWERFKTVLPAEYDFMMQKKTGFDDKPVAIKELRPYYDFVDRTCMNNDINSTNHIEIEHLVMKHFVQYQRKFDATKGVCQEIATRIRIFGERLNDEVNEKETKIIKYEINANQTECVIKCPDYSVI